jgi:V/A-type H+/Na+-transporting ATPase subunit D
MQKVKPTRIELLKLKDRLKKSKRGHKLLKEKRDGLMKRFMDIVKQAKSKRKEMEEGFAKAAKDFAIVSSSFSQKEIEEFFLIPSFQIDLQTEEENIMGVKVPNFKCSISKKDVDYSYISFPIGLENSIKKFQDVLGLMLDLANIEHAARLLSFEIEKTRRRVNALEYIIIPQIEKNIKYISSKLDENERFEKVIRLKIKELIS